MFGVDALERKYGPTPPMEWRSMVDGLNDAQLSTGIASVAASGSSHMPTLPEFMKRCREAREFSSASVSHQLEDDRFDGWARAGNGHLMAYLSKQGSPKRYHPDSRISKNVRGFEVLPGRKGHELTMILVRAKNRWAQIMRESVEDGQVDVETQQAVWADQMAQVEREIDAIAARAA